MRTTTFLATGALALVLPLALSGAAGAAPGASTTIAVIGDTPYGARCSGP